MIREWVKSLKEAEHIEYLLNMIASASDAEITNDEIVLEWDGTDPAIITKEEYAKDVWHFINSAIVKELDTNLDKVRYWTRYQGKAVNYRLLKDLGGTILPPHIEALRQYCLNRYWEGGEVEEFFSCCQILRKAVWEYYTEDEIEEIYDEMIKEEWENSNL